MARGRSFRVGLTLGTAIAVVLLGAGAYAFGPARADAFQRSWKPPATGVTGESASPRPEPSKSTESVPVTAPTSRPPVAPTTTAPKPVQPVATQCQQGERQRDVETYLSRLGGYGPVTVDGVQSDADCAAIAKFQRRFGISPAKGRAGPTTADVARRIATSHAAAEQAKCNTGGAALVVCVDLTQQTAWAVRGGTVVWGPTVVRTGMSGYATPAGRYQVFNRSTKEWSVPYKVWLPWWQAFNGGIGFHETTTYIHDGSIGSHGCVNLLHADAVSLWNLTTVGTAVRVFGSRPGT
jgi:lipoprotein-anchoring transpeptidase ErfK/SrfK